MKKAIIIIGSVAFVGLVVGVIGYYNGWFTKKSNKGINDDLLTDTLTGKKMTLEEDVIVKEPTGKTRKILKGDTITFMSEPDSSQVAKILFAGQNFTIDTKQIFN